MIGFKITDDLSLKKSDNGLHQSLLIAAAALTMSVPAFAQTPEQAFLAGNRAAMARMMTGMNAKPSGDVDIDFVNMMEPHHKGAIDMAALELKFGKNAKLRRIAQDIIKAQQPQIDAMRMALGRPPRRLSPVTSEKRKVPMTRLARPPSAASTPRLESGGGAG